MSRFEILYLVSQYLILAAALIYAFLALLQWAAIRRQANIAAQANRPFLLITYVRSLGEFVGQSGRGWNFGVTLNNYGIGPADIADYIIDWGMFDKPPPDPIINYGKTDGNRLNDSLVGPSKMAEDHLRVTISLTDENIRIIGDDTKRIAIHGRVRYRGAHEKIYESRFFWWFFIEDRSFVRALSPELNSHT